MILSSLFCALLFCLVFVSVVTIASEPALIDYDRSFEKKIAMSMSIRCHTGMWTDNFLISANYCTACFCDNQHVETVKFLVCDAVQHIKNKNLCGRDGRTLCGPLRVPKSTYVSENQSFSILDVRS